MRLFKRMLAAALLFLAAEYPVYAQSQLGTGALSGTVQDAGGALIIGAKVTVTNDDTGLTRTSVTNEAGQFTVPVLPVGAYTVRVTQTGFAAAEQKGLIVNVGGNSSTTFCGPSGVTRPSSAARSIAPRTSLTTPRCSAIPTPTRTR